MGLDFVALVSNDEVGLPREDFLFQPPRRFVVDHGHLQGGARKVPEGIGLFCAAAGEHREGVSEIRKLGELVLPDAEDGEGGHDQRPMNVAGEVQRPGDADAGDRFASPQLHLHQKSASGANFDWSHRHHLLRPAVPASGRPDAYGAADAPARAEPRGSRTGYPSGRR